MECASYDSSKLLYDRVRIVSIDCEGFMSCSCGYVQMYLMPCRHICAVIDDKQLYVPSMFHIIWYKLYNYYHGNTFGIKLATHSTVTLSNIVCWTRDNCFRESGSYKGVYVRDSLFFKQLPCFTSLKSDISNLVPNLMTTIINKNNRGYAVLKDSIQFNEFDVNSEFDEIDDETSIKGIDIDVKDNMGGSSQVECYLSQQREENDNHVVNNCTTRKTYYKEVLPLFEEIVNSFPNKHLFDEMCELMRNRHMIHIASRGINNQLCNSKGMTLFGENNTNKRSMKRHKFMHER